MAQSKFASITADLLARKGDARPWIGSEPAQKRTTWESSAAIAYPPTLVAKDAAEPEPLIVLPHARSAGDDGSHPGSDGMRKITLRISHIDYERLGIIAAKRDITRQFLMREVLDDYLAAAADDYSGRCCCIAGCACDAADCTK